MVLLVISTPVIMRDTVSLSSENLFVLASRASEGNIANRRMLDNQETRDVRVDTHLHPEHRTCYSLHKSFSLQNSRTNITALVGKMIWKVPTLDFLVGDMPRLLLGNCRHNLRERAFTTDLIKIEFWNQQKSKSCTHHTSFWRNLKLSWLDYKR